MRIIAVGDSVRPPTAEPTPDIDPDSYPPSASRLGTTVRRSSRPLSTSATAAAASVQVPKAAPMPTDLGPSIELDVPIDVELPVGDLVAALDAAAAALEASSVEAPSAPSSVPLEARRPPAPPPPVELADDEFSPESIARKIAAAEASEAAAAAQAAEELGREDAISMPPEELTAEQAELDAKADAAKPPPPPKRAPGTPPSAPPAVESASTASTAPAASAPPRDTPPTPDLAAAKAAQRSKTRAPWWEDLFNEDFMRASSRVSDEHIRREVTFIEESLGVAAGGVVLDLGCGSGHHAVEFASRGYGVVGYDLSLYQLALAADVAQERSQKINFLQGDMREMAFEEMFDGVFCWNTTFGYFEEDKNLAVAQRVFKALRPGGMFLIDVINRDFAAASAPCTVWVRGRFVRVHGRHERRLHFEPPAREALDHLGRRPHQRVAILASSVLAARARQVAARSRLPGDRGQRSPRHAGRLLRSELAAHHHARAASLTTAASPATAASGFTYR
ncbi:MAG: class I SAM-dependent methyltransferase [Pseudomonadota bacterium]